MFPIGEEVHMRMFFTENSYIPVTMKVKYSREQTIDREPYTQYGCEFDTSAPCFEAMASFIDFLYKFAEHSSINKEARSWFF